MWHRVQLNLTTSDRRRVAVSDADGRTDGQRTIDGVQSLLQQHAIRDAMKRPLGRRRRDRRKEGRKERQAGRSLRGHFVQWKRPLALFALRRSSVRLRTLSDRTDHPAIRLRVEVTACSSVLRLLDRSKYTLSSCRPPRWKILGTLLSSLVRIVDNDIRAIAMGFHIIIYCIEFHS